MTEKSDFNSKESDTVNQTEDAVMKVMMEFFTEEMLPLFGITQKAIAFIPTEDVHIELMKGYQDFNLEMEDGSIAHFEFQSTNGGVKDLRRFKAYEGNLNYKLQKPVTTYVLFSGKIKCPMTQITEGINSYRIKPIIMRERDADLLLAKLQAKVSKNIPLTRRDLSELPMLPIFGGESSQLERIQAAFEITTEADQIPQEDIEKIEAAIYAMATKFLNHNELEQIKGGVKMTYLGQLLVEDGRKEGREEGRKEGRKEEQKNTERERLRADKAEQELQELKKRFGLE
ncbi:MAG: hypothetical protein LUI07_04330 [Lachnospiraceae bacterium]|nr:hypothetical protein [Lachnospiraceae bacterium]